jgi:hypothetical protein
LAIFNPAIPNVNPQEWTNVSRPISQPEADKSIGLSLSTAALGLEEGAKLADTTEKAYLKDKVETGVNKLRDDTTTVYEGIRNLQTQSVTADQPNQTLAAADAPPVPAGLQNGLAKAQAIGTAQSQNMGKLNDTFYTMNLKSLAKSLRNEYPGYKDYIDEEIHKVSGIDPANAYMKNLLEDINRNSTEARSEKDKAIALGRQWLGADQHMPGYIEAVRQGLPGAVQNLESAVNTAASNKYKFDNWHQNNQMTTGDRAEDAVQAQDQYRTEAYAAAHRIYNGVVAIPGLTAPATISKIIADDQNGINPLSDEQKGMLLQAMRSAQQQFKAEAINIQNGKGRYATRIQDQKTLDSITEGAGQFFTNQIDNIGNDKMGSMYANQRRVESITKGDAPLQVLSSPDLGAYAKTTAVWTQFGGPNWVNTAQAQFLTKGGAGKFTNFLEDLQKKAQTPDDLRNDGVVKAMYDDIARVKRYASENNEKVPKKVYNNIVDNVNTIVDPKAPEDVKKEVVKYAFNPKNWKIMDQFGTDFTDANGIQHKGRNSVFDTMTSQKVTDGIWNLKDNNAWGMYKNWAEQSFKTIMGEEIKAMNTIQADKSMMANISWDADNSRFNIQYPKPTTTVEANYIKESTASINRLNAGLYNLKTIQGHEKEDTSTYLMKTMIDFGYTPDAKVQGLPQQIIDQIKYSHRSNKIEDAYKAAK